MTESGEKKKLSGVARSIDELFSAPTLGDETPTTAAAVAGTGAPPEAEDLDLTWEDVPEPEPVSARVPPDPASLSAAVGRFLASDPFERDGQAHDIRESAAALREANAFDPLANAVEALVAGAGGGDSPDEACLAVARSLVSAGVASRLASRLGSERDDDRRAQLIELCRTIGREMALAISDALSDTQERSARRTFMDAMIAMGEPALEVAAQMVEDGRWFVVRNGVAILGEVGGDRAVELVTSSLAHTDGRVRREALLALARVGGEDAGMLVYGMLDDPDPDVRLAAAMAAGALKVERALRPLLALLEGETNPEVLVGMLHALGQLGDPGAVLSIEKHAVASFFSRPAVDVRIAAYRALHKIGTPHARRLLGQAVDDKDPTVKAAVRQLLGMR